MNDKRRNFLKTATAIAAVSSFPKLVLAEDYSKDNSVQRKYIYNPFAQEQSASSPSPVLTQQNYQIQNNILPQNQQQDFWAMPRRVYLKRRDTGECADMYYYANGQVNFQDYKTACYLLRDIHQNQMVGMDVRLLDLMCAVQAWLIHYGFTGPILVNSGFRTLKTNSGLEGAAKNSMHLYGRAIDFTVPGLPPASLALIAAQFRAGGIGIYPNQNFVHLDTGGVRVWVKR